MSFERMTYYIKHRTASETSGSGHVIPAGPWKIVGPFDTYAAALAVWEKIIVSWQEGGIYTKCEHCGLFAPTNAADAFKDDA